MSDNNIRISIVIPLYNNEKYIVNCIESILNQEYYNYEIIIIDDGSTDNGYSLVKNKYSNDKIKIIYQNNKGPSSARNEGIRNANGDWILFLDSDDKLAIGALQTLVKHCKNYDLVLAGWVGDYINRKEYYGPQKSGEIENEGLEDLVSFLVSNATLFNDEFCNIPSIEGPVAKLYSMKIIKDNNVLFPEELRYAEDVVFNFKYLQYCNKIYSINKSVYQASRHTDSLSNQKKNWISMYNSFERSIRNVDIKRWNINSMLLQRKFVWLINSLEENINRMNYEDFNDFCKKNKVSELYNINVKRCSLLKKIEYHAIIKNSICYYYLIKIGLYLKNIKKR
ncbi:MAG: glycosyltransferase family 2 protein [Clostridium sp.]|nr:glycosyltransferase family 2 protein [Clostridium sp.]